MNIRRMLQIMAHLGTAVFYLSAKLREVKKEGRGRRDLNRQRQCWEQVVSARSGEQHQLISNRFEIS